MKYPLALQLKEAGFPQNLHDEHGGCFIGENYVKDPNDKVCCPTLEELIDACELGLIGMDRDSPDTWKAVGQINGKLFGITKDSLSEAVAKLYIKLNEHKD